jgi:phosphatidylinositol alpha-1,6-mannosyltransferase
MERLIAHCAEELAAEFDLAVCGPEGCATELHFAQTVLEAPTRPLSKFLIGNFSQTIKLARQHRPELIFCGSGLTVPTALVASRLCGAPVIAYLHGLDIVADQFVYRTVWRKALPRVDIAIANSRNTARLASGAGIPENRIRILNPGVQMPAPKPGAIADFRAQYDLGSSPILLSVGRLTARKGLAEFIEHSLPAVLHACPEVKFLIIGEEATDALVSKGTQQKQRILDSAARAGVASSIRLLGGVTDETLSAAFLASGAFVFPVLDLPGDVEGFGMVAVEAAAHGTPTVAFSAGGVADAVSEPSSGTLVPAGDYSAMAKAVLGFLNAPADAALRDRRVAFATQFAWPNFGEQLRALCRHLLA